MTPEQKIKHMILHAVADRKEEDTVEITADNIDAVYDEAYQNDDGTLQDVKHEIRAGEFETELPCEWSRHYESKSVAARAPDGSWVGWTYWYGGGKHGEPEAVVWMDEAYDLDVTEEEKLVVVRTFKKVA